ncbi:Hypothetical protein NGAL_HAMBI2605_32260 [Neorhizobium galegae bv. orientalis]|nr:Hypothetical protein NGAL_HAMBI2566_41040 [Neorhizobium galegae bv. orientalis]CDZ64901.1 Hypothetical protein NGAL_HAMBI2605_32260 [Neorhizobium galegae bv. orientalis]
MEVAKAIKLIVEFPNASPEPGTVGRRKSPIGVNRTLSLTIGDQDYVILHLHKISVSRPLMQNIASLRIRTKTSSTNAVKASSRLG